MRATLYMRSHSLTISATHNEETNTWTPKTMSHGPDGKMTMKGWVRNVDGDTMEWRWAEYAMGGLVKTMEMCGTSKRK